MAHNIEEIILTDDQITKLGGNLQHAFISEIERLNMKTSDFVGKNGGVSVFRHPKEDKWKIKKRIYKPLHMVKVI
jgi:hypothetical protein